MEKRDYRRMSKPPRDAEDTPPDFMAVSVKANTRLNVREQPSTDAKVLEILEPGTKVLVQVDDVEIQVDKFLKVFDADTKRPIGYCMREFFDISNGGAKA